MSSDDDRATELEVWSSQTNSTVVRVPGRRFPAVAIQGDTLSSLFGLAMDVLDKLRGTECSDAYTSAEHLAEKLFIHLRNYEAVLRTRGVPLPYARDTGRVPKVGGTGETG